MSCDVTLCDLKLNTPPLFAVFFPFSVIFFLVSFPYTYAYISINKYYPSCCCFLYHLLPVCLFPLDQDLNLILSSNFSSLHQAHTGMGHVSVRHTIDIFLKWGSYMLKVRNIVRTGTLSSIKRHHTIGKLWNWFIISLPAVVHSFVPPGCKTSCGGSRLRCCAILCNINLFKVMH